MMTRRGFLRGMGSGLAVGALPLTAALGQEETVPFEFGLSTIMYHDTPLEHALAEIAKSGCTSVDLWDNPRGPVNHMDWVAEKGPQALKSLLSDLGLTLYAFSIYWSPGGSHEERLEWLAEAGGQVAVLAGGAKAGSPVQAGIDRLMPLAEKAGELGLRIAGENHGGSSLSTIASMREYVELADHEALGVALAPFHVMGEKESVAEAVRALGDKLFFFYAWQRAPEMAELPGDGTLDFKPVLGALRDVGFAGPLNIFTHTHVAAGEMTAAVGDAREYLERTAASLPTA